MRLVWLPEAKVDIERLFHFLVTKNPAAAGRAVGTIRAGADRLAGTPELGRPLGDDTHRRELFLPFGGGAYVLRYRLHGGDVVIIRVWHSREQR